MPTPEDIARVAHECNRVFCEYVGDSSQLPWEFAPDWQKRSCIDGVEFTIANPNAGDAANHDNWSRMKRAEGWVHGAIKDPEAKTHPCLVPFGELPVEQQFKDRLFRTVVLACLEEAPRD